MKKKKSKGRKDNAINVSQLAKADDPRERKRAAEFLKDKAHFNDTDLKPLNRLIRDENRDVWVSASYTLGHQAVSSKEAYNLLMDLVNDDNFFLKKRGIYALGEYSKYDHEGISRLYDLASSKRKDIVADVVGVLGSLAGKEPYAHEVILDLLETREEYILEPVISLLGSLAPDEPAALEKLRHFLREKNNFIRLWSSAAIGRAASFDDSAFATYKEFLKSKDVYLRRGFARALFQISEKQPKQAKSLIERAIGDPDRYVRTNAVASLGSLCRYDKEAFSAIKGFLSHKNADIRRGAADALLRVPRKLDSQVKKLIPSLMGDEDYYLRSAAAFACAKIMHVNLDDAVDMMLNLAEDKDEYVRRDLAIAIRGLDKKARRSVKPILKKLIIDRDSIVRKEAILSLADQVDNDPFWVLNLTKRIAGDLDDKVRENAVYVIGCAAKKSPNLAFERILDFLSWDSVHVMENMALSLERIFEEEPDLFFERLRILQTKGVNPTVLGYVSKYARSEDIGAICAIYLRLSSEISPSEVEEILVSALYAFEDAKSLKHAKVVKDLFEVLLYGIRARDINDIALIKFDTSSIGEVFRLEDPLELESYLVLQSVTDMALRFKQIEGLSDKHIYLGKMLALLDSHLEGSGSAQYPEMYILNKVLHNFRLVVSSSMDTLKGRSNLRINLRTKKVLPQDTINLLLAVENRGDSMSENIEISIMPSPSYKIIDKTQRIQIIPQNRNDSVEFKIRPGKKRGFRARFHLKWDDLEMKGRTMEFADRVSFIDIPKKFRYIPNPYITGGPIKPPSASMFFGREDVFSFVRDNISSTAQKNMLILQGERRTGKTSILYQIPRVLGDKYVCVFMDGQEFAGADMKYFLFRLAKQAEKACSNHNIKVTLPPKSAFEEDPWFAFKDLFLDELTPRLEDRVCVFLFDEFESLEHAVTKGTMDPVIFSYIRNLMQHEDKLAFIFAGVHRLEEMMQDYWGVMFNIAMYWKISFLKESETRKLITKPVEGFNMIYDDLALEKIIRATANHPYFVQLLCRFLVNRHNTEKRNYITVQDVNEELINVIEKAKPHFDYIWALSSQYERLVLALLVDVLRRRRNVTYDDLLSETLKLRFEPDKKRFSKAISDLCAKDIIESVKNGTEHYRFKVDFIRMWIESHQSLARVIGDLREQGKELDQ